jgi:hypothetical protein
MFKRKKKHYDDIEPGIAPLVIALNATGFATTKASCEGHCRIMSHPYVYFSAPTQYVAILERLYREEDTLFRSWSLCGEFDPSFEMMFTLQSPLCVRKMVSLSWAYWLYGVKRKRINDDIKQLAVLVRRAERLYQGSEVHNQR